jgi:hypothetical protein
MQHFWLQEAKGVLPSFVKHFQVLPNAMITAFVLPAGYKAKLLNSAVLFHFAIYLLPFFLSHSHLLRFAVKNFPFFGLSDIMGADIQIAESDSLAKCGRLPIKG